MDDKVIIKISKNNLIYDEKIDILVEGVCRGIFPLSIVHKNDMLIACYNIAGYKRLSQFKNLSAESILTIIEKIIIAMEECCQYLIFPEEFIMNTNTIYVDEQLKTVKFTYIPDSDGEKIKNKFARLLNDLKITTTDNGRLYLEMLIQLCSVDNLSYKKLRLLVAKLSQEVKKYDCV